MSPKHTVYDAIETGSPAAISSISKYLKQSDIINARYRGLSPIGYAIVRRNTFAMHTLLELCPLASKNLYTETLQEFPGLSCSLMLLAILQNNEHALACLLDHGFSPIMLLWKPNGTTSTVLAAKLRYHNLFLRLIHESIQQKRKYKQMQWGQNALTLHGFLQMLTRWPQNSDTLLSISTRLSPATQFLSSPHQSNIVQLIVCKLKALPKVSDGVETFEWLQWMKSFLLLYKVKETHVDIISFLWSNAVPHTNNVRTMFCQWVQTCMIINMSHGSSCLRELLHMCTHPNIQWTFIRMIMETIHNTVTRGRCKSYLPFFLISQSWAFSEKVLNSHWALPGLDSRQNSTCNFVHAVLLHFDFSQDEDIHYIEEYLQQRDTKERQCKSSCKEIELVRQLYDLARPFRNGKTINLWNISASILWKSAQPPIVHSFSSLLEYIPRIVWNRLVMCD